MKVLIEATTPKAMEDASRRGGRTPKAWTVWQVVPGLLTRNQGENLAWLDEGDSQEDLQAEYAAYL